MTDPYDPDNKPPRQSGPPQGSTPPPGYGPPRGDGQSQPGYGAPTDYQGQPPSGGHGGPKKNGFGIAALVLGILALVSFFTIFGGIVFGIPALVLGFLGRKRVSRNEADNGGVALAGIITGALGLLGAVVLLALAVFVATSGDFGSFAECSEAAQTQAELDQCGQDFADSVTQ